MGTSVPSSNEQRVIGQSDDPALPQDLRDRTLDSLARFFIDDAEDRVEGRAARSRCRPAGQCFRDRVHERHQPRWIGCNHGIADASERDRQALFARPHLGGVATDDEPEQRQQRDRQRRYRPAAP
jgi:hypothetical protein